MMKKKEIRILRHFSTSKPFKEYCFFDQILRVNSINAVVDVNSCIFSVVQILDIIAERFVFAFSIFNAKKIRLKY